MSFLWHSLKKLPRGFSKTAKLSHPNFFGLKLTDEVRTYGKKSSFLSIFEFHVYEMFQLLCKNVRREHHSLLVNNFRSTSEVKRCLYDQRPKSLTTKYIMKTANKRGPKHENVYCSTQSLIWTGRY